MGWYVVRRLIHAVPILFGVTVLTFAVLAAAPGDPVLLMVAPEQQSTADLAIRQGRIQNDPPSIHRAHLFRKASPGNLGGNQCLVSGPFWPRLVEITIDSFQLLN